MLQSYIVGVHIFSRYVYTDFGSYKSCLYCSCDDAIFYSSSYGLISLVPYYMGFAILFTFIITWYSAFDISHVNFQGQKWLNARVHNN